MSDGVRILAIFSPVILMFAFMGYMIYTDVYTPFQDDTFELYSCDAPDGHYYSNVEGGMFYLDTNLGNSYVMRYIDDSGELRTIIIESTNEHLHTYLFENGTDTMHVRVHYQFHNDNGTYGKSTEYYLYVPDPKTM